VPCTRSSASLTTGAEPTRALRPDWPRRGCGDEVAGPRFLMNDDASMSSRPPELTALQVGFVSLSEALDLTTPSGRALAGMLAVFAEFERDILRDRVKAGIAQARKEGRPHGRPRTISRRATEVKNLFHKVSASGRSPSGSVLAGRPFVAYWVSDLRQTP
jgi:hypothetical protein